MSCRCEAASSPNPVDKSTHRGPGSPQQPLEETEHSEECNKPQRSQGHPYDDSPWPILLMRAAAAHLCLDFSVPFPGDAFWVGRHRSPIVVLIGRIKFGLTKPAAPTSYAGVYHH